MVSDVPWTREQVETWTAKDACNDADIVRALIESWRASFYVADDVARFMREQGITGYQGRACECPLARAIHSNTGIVVEVSPLTIYTKNDDPDAHFRGERVFNSMPYAMREFVRRFDGGLYEDLIAAPEAEVEKPPVAD